MKPGGPSGFSPFWSGRLTVCRNSPFGAQRPAATSPERSCGSSGIFNPAGSTNELEDYEVNFDGVSALELLIRPDLTNNEAIATLAAWRVA